METKQTMGNQTCVECGEEFQNEIDDECPKCGHGKTSQINGLTSIEERLRWCEQYIKILLTSKDESEQMHILDGKEISEIKQRLAKLEGGDK